MTSSGGRLRTHPDGSMRIFADMKRSHLTAIAAAAIGAWAIARAARSRFSFADKIVVITGGSRGLGLVIARQLVKEHARLALLARDPDELASARSDLEAHGGDILTLTCDLTDPAQISAAAEKILTHFGGVDVLINNAGVIEVGPLEHMRREDFERSLAIHFWAARDLTMRLVPEMRNRGGGRIVNISSIGGKIAAPHLAPYTAGKFALTGFSDSIRAELAASGIYVTTVAPGLMRTGSHLNARFKGDHRAEFAWFSFANGLPLISISAERAAAKIIAACRRGQPSLTLTFAARTAIAANAIAPNLTGYAIKTVNQFLPRPTQDGGDELRTGWESRGRMPGLFTRHLANATRRNNEDQAPRSK
jgi:NAD(P)-dependent dehydrogenase (short-subunit alcohol dehydrogenase family)